MAAGVPNTFSPGEVMSSAAVNANFAALVNYLNGLNIPTTPVTVLNGGTGSSTPQGALTALGLAVGSIIPCTASAAGQVISLVGGLGSPTVQTYQNGTTYCFVAPAAMSGATDPILIQDTTTVDTTLLQVGLYDSPGAAYTQSIVAGQLCIISYSSTVGGFVLVNTPPIPNNAARFQQFLATTTWTCPAGLTTVYATICGGGGGGGATNAALIAGGGGGGAGAAYKKQPINVLAGSIYAIAIGAAGLGGNAATNGGTGGTGGTSSIISPTFVTLITCPGGQGGSGSTSTTDAPGGANGGTGGQPGTYGHCVVGQFGEGGAGGGCLLGAGGPPVCGALPGTTPGEFGGGGGGGGSGSAGSGAGGQGGAGYVLLEW